MSWQTLKLQFTLLDLQRRSGYDCYAGLPSNFMSICLAKDVREVKKSSLATSASGIWLSIYAIFGVVVLGAVAKGYMVSDPEAGILELCSMAGSPLMLGLVCTFILAAALGTLDPR